VTVALEVAVPPGPLAVRVYVVVSLGNTWRVPETLTGPMPGWMETSVASLTIQRSVEDCPRSIVLGSATNCWMLGAFGGGGAGCSGGGGGGGGGGGAFFLHPATNSIKDRLNRMLVMFRVFILNFASLTQEFALP